MLWAPQFQTHVRVPGLPLVQALQFPRSQGTIPCAWPHKQSKEQSQGPALPWLTLLFWAQQFSSTQRLREH